MNKIDKAKLIEMGKNAKKIYEKHLSFGHWCKYVIKELKNIKNN